MGVLAFIFDFEYEPSFGRESRSINQKASLDVVLGLKIADFRKYSSCLRFLLFEGLETCFRSSRFFIFLINRGIELFFAISNIFRFEWVTAVFLDELSDHMRNYGVLHCLSHVVRIVVVPAYQLYNARLQ